MRSLPLIFAIMAMLPACTQERLRPPPIPQSANPSAVVALEMAMAREAKEKGEISTLRKYAAKEALVFNPQPVTYDEATKGLKDPKTAAKWQPHKVYMSCDGRTALAYGAWQASGQNGYFIRAWQWFPRSKEAAMQQGTIGDGEWRWLMRYDDVLETSLPPAETIETKTASCKGRAPTPLTAPPVGAKMKLGFAFDQSLQWSWVVTEKGARTFEARIWNGETIETVITYVSPLKSNTASVSS
jgi:hypothetical protein